MAQSTAWLKKITPEIFESLSLSDQGTPPLFPMEEFTNSLKESIGQKDLSITLGKMDFIEEDAFFSGLGQKTLSTPLGLSPLEGIFHLVMGIDDIKVLINSMEDSTDEPGISLEDDSVIKGVYTYFMTEAIDSIMQQGVYKDLSLKIMDGEVSEHSAFAIDFSITIKGNHLPGRILVPLNFYKAFESHYTFIPPTLENLDNIPDVNIPMSIHTGSVTLQQKELKEIEEGDYLLIHNSFYSPSKKKGSFQMRVGKSPLFQVKKQKDGIKILDYLYFYNEENMDENEENPPLGDEFEDDHSDFEASSDDFDDEIDESDDEINGDDAQAEDDVVDASIDASAEGELDDDLTSDEDLSDIDEDLSDIDEDLSDIDEDLSDIDDDDTFITPEKTNLSDIPLTIQMEIARFTISLEELKKMGPGFKLPVNINPNQVNLMISGKSIGTGEIIEVGDVIGVKVTSLNK